MLDRPEPIPTQDLRIGNVRLYPINPQVDPTDLWRNVFWLRDRLTRLEQQVEQLAQQANKVK